MIRYCDDIIAILKQSEISAKLTLSRPFNFSSLFDRSVDGLRRKINDSKKEWEKKNKELLLKNIPDLLRESLEKAKDLERGLRICSNGLCHSRFLHRDENAAKNITKALVSRITKGSRPTYLSRKSKASMPKHIESSEGCDNAKADNRDTIAE